VEEGAGPEGRMEEEERGFPEESRCCSPGAGKEFSPDPNFFYSGSQIQIFSIPDPGFKFFYISDSGSASNNLSILTQKSVSKLSEI
jgi:hypothetical protein